MSLSVGRDAKVVFPNGLLGFPDCREFFFEDTGEGSLILWLRSLDHGKDNRKICFPVLEPRVFMPQYSIKLSAVDVRELKMDSVDGNAAFCVLSIPEDITQMTANLRAPLVVNVQAGVGKQVVLQDNELSLKHPMYRELRAHQKMLDPQGAAVGAAASGAGTSAGAAGEVGPVPLVRLSGAKGILTV